MEKEVFYAGNDDRRRPGRWMHQPDRKADHEDRPAIRRRLKDDNIIRTGLQDQRAIASPLFFFQDEGNEKPNYICNRRGSDELVCDTHYCSGHRNLSRHFFPGGVYFRKHCAGELNIFYRDGVPYLSLALNSFDALSRKNWAGFRIVRRGLPRD